MSDYDNTDIGLRHLSGCRPKPASARFFQSFAQVDSGCWEWLGSVRGYGYGRINVEGSVIPAHRYSYQLHIGEIPEGMMVCHTCDNPKCVNPGHLFVGTHQDNMMDRNKKKRTSSGTKHGESVAKNTPKGEKNAQSKLTAHDVRDIRESGLSQRILARAYGVSQCSIHNIKSLKTWSHV